MDFNNFTIKAQEAIQKALQIANEKGQQAIEPLHILKGVMEAEQNVTQYIFNKCGVNQNIIYAIDSALQSLPRVSGGEPYLSREANEVIVKAVQLSRDNGDQFASVEFLLLALLKVNSQVSQMLKDAGATEKAFEEAIKELRKGSKVNSQSAEDTYNALSKYAINLNERARNGKLDPVIGVDD